VRRPIRIGVLAATVLTSFAMLPGCGRRHSGADEVRAAIHRTRAHVTGVVYRDRRGDRDVAVRLAQIDDFRYKARVFYDGTPGFDEVAVDDVLALRFDDTSRIDGLRTPEGGAELTELSGITTVDVLQSRRWVLDVGAAPFTQGGGTTGQALLGKDPVADALQALDYTEAATSEAADVGRYNPDSIAPAFTKTEDDLPKPKPGEIRYDLRRPKLPVAAAASTGAQGQLAFPGTKHFRKMAVYVRDGIVTRVVEHVALSGKFLRDTVRYERVLLREVKAPAAVRREFERLLLGSEDQVAARVLEFVNVGLQIVGQESILVRNMSLDVTVGGTAPVIDVPVQDVVKGDLSGLVVSAAAKAAAQQAPPGGASAASTTSTTGG
jgi:hypothetical protein